MISACTHSFKHLYKAHGEEWLVNLSPLSPKTSSDFFKLFYYTREECVFGWLYVFVCFSIIFSVNIVGMKSDVLLLQR